MPPPAARPTGIRQGLPRMPTLPGPEIPMSGDASAPARKPGFLHRPFLACLTLAVLFLTAFGGWTALVTAQAFDAWDTHVAETFAGRHWPRWRTFMVVVTETGGITANVLF